MAHRKIIFTDSERERLNGSPADISTEDLISYYTLTEPYKSQIQSKRGDHNRLGFSLGIIYLRRAIGFSAHYPRFLVRFLFLEPLIVVQQVEAPLRFGKFLQFLIIVFGQ